MKMLILTGSPDSYSVQRIKDEAQKRGHEVDIKKPSDFICYVSDIARGLDRMYLKEGKNETTRVKAKDYDVIIPRFAGAHVFEYGCVVTEHFSGNMGIPTTSIATGLRIASNKFLCSQYLSQGKVRTIKTLFSQQPADFSFISKALDEPPIVCKTTTGSQGAGVFILSDELGLSTTLSVFSKNRIPIVLQKFINSGEPKTDIRAYVVNGKVSAAYMRYALDGDFRSNYSLSKLGEKVELSEEETEMAIKAAKALGLGVAAVDIIRNSMEENQPYVIEVNGNGNLRGIEKVTGENVALDIVLYAEAIGKKQRTAPQAPPEPSPEGKKIAAALENIGIPTEDPNSPAVKPGMTIQQQLEAVKQRYGI